MKIKTIEVSGETHAVLQDGKPVYVHDDGKEVAFDAPQAMAKIASLNRENQTHREKYEETAGKLRLFEGIEDPEAARAALQTVADLKDERLVAAGKLEEIRVAAERAVEQRTAAQTKVLQDKLDEATRERDTFRTRFHTETIGNAFGKSKFLSERVNLPVDLAQDSFGKYFSVDDETGRIVAKDAQGSPIPSSKRLGEPADFEEAIESIVMAYPHRDQILKGTGSAGSGARERTGGGSKRMTRAEFERLDHSARLATIKAGTELVD